MIGVFSATDALLFYSSGRRLLIPMFSHRIWGGPRRVYATSVLLYTFLGSVLMWRADLHVREGCSYAIASLQACRSRSFEQALDFLSRLLLPSR